MKKVLLTCDQHAGHQGGLTPPAFQYKADDWQLKKYAELQVIVWNWFVKQVRQIGPVDLHVNVGDGIDGKAPKNAGIELITTDRYKQCRMAAEGIRLIKTKKRIIVRGTKYHTGEGENWEDVLAGMVDADKVGWHEWADVDGTILDFRHKMSKAPSAPTKEAIANILWAEKGVQPISDILFRAHVHKFVYRGDARRLVMTLPCLQAFSEYGVANISDTIDMGMVYVECHKGGFTWRPILMDLRFMAVQPLTL